MKSPAKTIISAMIFGIVFLNAGLVFSKTNDIDSSISETIISANKDETVTEKRREFWEKFRESVKPREETPRESEKPQEIHPHEIHPEEEKPE